jgi:spermidine/putrescine-binding protein
VEGGTSMKKVMLCIILLLAGYFTGGPWPVLAASETINVTCWEGYADKAFIDAFKSIVKDKYKMDVQVKVTYATGQEDFYNAAKNGTADLISPPADTLKNPAFQLF